jgi:cytochrome c oxidase subunit 3
VFYAVKAANSGNTRRAVRYLVFTILGGLGFLILHLNEWRGLIQQGVRLAGNPWGTSLFGGTFFTLTGLHMAHVAIGVLYIGFIAHSLAAARCTAGDVEVSSVYWYFVDVVWIFLFAAVYLLPA